MTVLADVVASLRASGATAELVRDDDDSAFAWAELGEQQASIDYTFDDDLDGWVARVSASTISHLILERRPSAIELHGIVLRTLQTETTTP